MVVLVVVVVLVAMPERTPRRAPHGIPRFFAMLSSAFDTIFFLPAGVLPNRRLTIAASHRAVDGVVP